MLATQTRTLQAGFGISLFILLATSFASFISITSLIRNSNEVNHTNEVIQELESIISHAKDAETGQRGFLISGDPMFLEPYNGAAGRAMQALSKAKRLTAESPVQQAELERLRTILEQRFEILRRSIELKLVDVNELRRGKDVMDKAREYVESMQSLEKTQLEKRTAKAAQFAALTPAIIIIAALIALAITVYFYRKVHASFQQNAALTKSLRDKDAEITTRIDLIQKIATQISEGDYKIRLNDEQTDGLGSLANSLNKMANALDESFTQLGRKEWLQSGAARLNDRMAGEQPMNTLLQNIISQLCEYVHSPVGAIFLCANENELILSASYGYKQIDESTTRFAFGEGVVGQSAQMHKEIVVSGIDNTDFTIMTSSGSIRPNEIVAYPVHFEKELKAVIELGSLEKYSSTDLEFLRRVSENIGIAINTTYNRVKLQSLLEETQAQSEELQAQHSELENLNTELEAQAEKLQASEEELKVQQEELTEINQELQERSRLLEEKNQLVVNRNLEIQKKSEELALSARYKSEFLANMSHELRTPLNSILLLSRLLGENNDKNLKPEQIEFAHVIQSSGNSLLLLIDDILDLSKIESGKMELEYETISVSDIAYEIRMMFEPLAKQKNVAFSVLINESLPETIETDKLRLEQIIKNLVSNALKFTTAGFVEVRFDPSPREGMIAISVKDSGIGIPKDKQSLIFEAFQQADGSTRRKFGGTGLGLSISRQLAVLLRGDIALDSTPGEGSTFTLTIPPDRQHVPIQETAPVEMPQLESEMPQETALAEQAAEDQLIKYRSPSIPGEIPDDRDNINEGDKVILIIEDDTSFGTALLDFTRKKGYKGLVAVRGDKGLELARRYKPVGILLDIVLPVKSGWEVMEELKQDKMTRHIPVHIMSSMEVKRQSLMSGAIDFINKPLAFEQLNTIFERIEFYFKKDSRKVLIIEDNSKHAEALSFFLSTNQITSEISDNIENGLDSLEKKEVDCVILDMGIPDVKSYEALETLKMSKGMENIPVIIFTGKSLSRNDEMRIRKYADSIVVKTAQSYRRILDEVSLFLHLVEENKKSGTSTFGRKGTLAEVLQHKKVLIADDDVRNIFSLTRALEQHQMQVIPAVDGKEALEMLQKNPDIDIVLMDMMMPEMDGYETISRIRESNQWKRLPIIAVTAKAMTGDREKCIQAGASDYISKPVDFDQLVSLLRIWLYDSTTKKTV